MTTSMALVVVPLHLEVRDPAVALGRGDMGMSQEILDGGERGIGIEELCGRAYDAANDTTPATPLLSRIVFDPLLDAPDGDRLALSSVPSRPGRAPSPSMMRFSRYATSAAQASSLT